MTRYVCRTLAIAQEQLAQANDGDTIVLTWPGANRYHCAAVESRALALGLDLIVHVSLDEPTPANDSWRQEQ